MKIKRHKTYQRLASFLLLAFIYTPNSYSAVDPMSSIQAITKQIFDDTGGRVNLSGYINGHVMNHDGAPRLTNKNINNALYQLREASLFADIILSDSLFFSTELEMSYDFTDKNDSGRDSRFEGLFNYYYFDLDVSNALDWDTDETGSLRVRTGRILVPFLRYNENKPSFKQHLMSQPFTAWQIAPVNNAAISYQQFGWTDTGVSFNWSYIRDDVGLFDVKLSIINGLGSESDVLDSNSVQLDAGMMGTPTVRPRDGLANARSEWDSFNDVNDDKAVVIQTSFSPVSTPLNVGLSWYKGAWDKSGDKDLTMYGAHLDYTTTDWSLKAEYVKADVDQTAGINVVTAMGPAAINTSTGDYSMQAWYVEGAYTFLRYGESNENNLVGVLRFDEVETNDKAVFTPFNRSRITVGLEWGFIRNMRLRAEVQRSKLDDFSAAPGPYISAGGDEHIDMAMLSLIAYF